MNHFAEMVAAPCSEKKGQMSRDSVINPAKMDEPEILLVQNNGK